MVCVLASWTVFQIGKIMCFSSLDICRNFKRNLSGISRISGIVCPSFVRHIPHIGHSLSECSAIRRMPAIPECQAVTVLTSRDLTIHCINYSDRCLRFFSFSKKVADIFRTRSFVYTFFLLKSLCSDQVTAL